MTDLWFQHLSSGLSQSGMIAYMWHPDEDRFEWAGDLNAMLGLNNYDRPHSNAQFHKLMNPQHIPARLTVLHDVMNKSGAGAQQPSFTASYMLRHENGRHIDVEEKAVLKTDSFTGKRLLCGFIMPKKAGQGTAASGHAMDNVEHINASMEHQGRTHLKHRVEQWAEHNRTMPLLKGYLLVIGMDRLGMFNEAFGPRFADELIEKTAERLQRIGAPDTCISRINGDVFGMLFEEAGAGEMEATAKSILNNFFEVPLVTSRGPFSVNVSVGGIALSPDCLNDSACILTKAEAAMHTAKNRGRSCFVSYADVKQNAAQSRRLLESGDAFLKAMNDDRVRLAFQPVQNMRKNRVSFHECLIRMFDEQGKIHAAANFMPAVEQLGLSRLVDQYAMRMAIQELSLFPDLTLSVNVSNITLADQEWLRNIVASLRDRPDVARRLIVEITESSAIQNLDNMVRLVRTLQDLGCRVALDDFGAGCTAFAQLKALNVDIVKIDKSFIRKINEDQNHLFVRTLHSLADGINIETVGEGAETISEAQLLVDDGIEHIQGYVFGFPQVERIWLPQEHSDRRIIEPGALRAESNAASQEVLEDLTAWQGR